MDVDASQQDRPADAIEVAAGLVVLWPRLLLAVSRAAMRQAAAVWGLDYSLIDVQGVAAAAGRFSFEWWMTPQLALPAQMELWWRNAALIAGPARSSLTGKRRAPDDKRFLDKAWREDRVLRLTRDLYQLNAAWILEQVRAARKLDRHEQRKLEFYTRQLLSALSPSNFAAINPRIRARAIETGGGSLIRGLELLVHDLEQAGSLVPITQCDPQAFKVGTDLATTSGKVVFRNALIELIQYASRSETVHRRPLLFVPPWINKYYILDLQPQNSLLRWIIEQGHTVFVISWVNPGTAHAATSLEDYISEGALAAIAVVREITGEDELNVCGFCIGGILTLCTLAYLAATGQASIQSATLLATMVDMTDVGDTAVFIDETQVAQLERHTSAAGFFDGCHMRDMFSLLRENDLIWSYVVEGYLMGRPPPAFDILHWNADSTRLPARMMSDFLRGIYMRNSLVEPGQLRLLGQPIDLRRVTTPCYFLSTIEDHIAPWRATYPALELLGGPVDLVLAGSGHIAGIINPPARGKYGYWTSTHHPATADAWLERADHHPGSWWPHWGSWLAEHGADKVKARAVGSRAHPPLINAPGTYALTR